MPLVQVGLFGEGKAAMAVLLLEGEMLLQWRR